MHQLTWLQLHFGFTIRQLAKLLRVSVTQIHGFAKGKRRLPVHAQALLGDGLLAPYPIEEEMAALPEPAWEVENRDMHLLEMEMRRNRLFLERRRLLAELEAMKTRHRQVHRLLYHTRNLPFTFKGGESWVELWWINLKALAREELLSMTLASRQKLEVKVAIMEAEFHLLQRWLAAEGRPVLDEKGAKSNQA